MAARAFLHSDLDASLARIYSSPSSRPSYPLSPDPVALSPGDYAAFAELHELLAPGIASALARWYSDPSLLPLAPRVRDLLLSAGGPPPSDNLGCFRPDVLFPSASGSSLSPWSSSLICEINARFALNGFLLSGAQAAASLSLLTRHGLACTPVSATLSFLPALCARFDSAQEVHVIVGEEPLHDLAVLQSRVHQLGSPLRFIFHSPAELTTTDQGDALICRDDPSVVISQCVLHLQQHELLALGDNVLACLLQLSLARRCLNPLWTIFLVHDKRFLALLRSSSPTLRHRIIPTTMGSLSALSTMLAYQQLVRDDASRIVFKPALSGKGQGIVIQQPSMSPDDLIPVAQAFVDRQELFVLQPFVTQRRFPIIPAPTTLNFAQWKMVGMLLCMDHAFYGPGIFRAADADLISLASGGVALVPVLTIPLPLKSLLLNEASPREIQNALIHTGITVLLREKEFPQPAEAITPEQLFAFLSENLAAQMSPHSPTVGAIWAVRPMKTDAAVARSHTTHEGDGGVRSKGMR